MVGLAVACASFAPSVEPRITAVAGKFARSPVSDACHLMEWTAPSGNPIRVCTVPATEFEITRDDVERLRIEERQWGDETWYVVSAFLSPDTKGRIVKRLRARWPVAATPYLARADAMARAWRVPVVRLIAVEIAARPIETVSMEELIARPQDWIGKRVSVEGHFAGALYRDRIAAVLNDETASIDLETTEDAPLLGTCDNVWTRDPALEACDDKRVRVDAFVDWNGSGLGSGIQLARVERIAETPGGPDCWPVSP